MTRPGSAGIERAALVAVAASLLLVATHQLVALDLWWQLAAGAWIADHGLPTTDPFSFGFPGLPWLEHRWLFFLAEHALATRWGLNGLILAKLVWLGGCLVLLNAAMRPAPRWARVLGLFAAVVLLHSRLKLRPELVSYGCVIGFLWAYEAHRRLGRSAPLLALPAIQLLWSNTHTLWIAGPALAWTAWAVEAGLARWPRGVQIARVLPALAPGRRRALLWAAVAVSVAGVTTPYLFLGQFYPTTILEQIGVGSELRGVIVELQSPFALRGDPVFFGTYLAGVGASFACMLLSVRPPLFRVVVWAGFVGFTFLAARNVALLGPVAGWVIAQQLGAWWVAGGGQRWPQLPRAAAVLTLMAAVSLGLAAITDGLWRPRGWDQRFGTGVREAIHPIEAMAFVTEQGLPRPVLSGLADASYLIYEGGPGSVFIDGRLEVYGADRVLDNARAWSNAEGVMADADRLGIDSVLLPFPLMSRALSGFEASEDWSPVYYDSARVLYLRDTPATRGLLAELALDWNGPPPARPTVSQAVQPRDWLQGIAPRLADVSDPLSRASLLLYVGAAEAAEAALAEVVQIEPGHPDAHLTLGLLASLAGQSDVADAHLAHVAPAVRAGPGVARMHFELSRLRGGPAQRFALALRAIEVGEENDRILSSVVELTTGPGQFARARPVLERALREADPARRDRVRAALRAIERRSAGGAQ